MEKGVYHRFVDLLGVKRSPPSLPALSELIAAHLSAIPFENISKLYYRQHYHLEELPSFERYLDGIERYHFGGTCYSNNFYFYRLLDFLGYRVKLCAADMKKPGSHMVIMLAMEQKEYLVDVGYAAPFFGAIPLHLGKDHTVINGRDRYIFAPRDNSGSTRMRMYRNGSGKHGYTVRPGAKQIEDFNQVISESFRPDSTFFRSLLISRYISGQFCTIHNLELIESSGENYRIRPIGDPEELVACIAGKFQIPEHILAEVIPELDLSGDAWS